MKPKLLQLGKGQGKTTEFINWLNKVDSSALVSPSREG
mgnify:CR=1 FL=1